MYSSFSTYLVRSAVGVRQAARSRGYRELELRPSSARALHAASASFDLPSGELRFGWVRSGGLQMDKVSEADVAQLSCGRLGGHIEAVEFASFGTPATRALGRGDDGDDDDAAGPRLWRHPECHAAASNKVVEQQCVERNNCTVAAHREMFGVDATMAGACSAAA